MPSLEHIQALLASSDWSDIESGLDELRRAGAEVTDRLGQALDDQLSKLVDHADWHVRLALARLLANLERGALLERLLGDLDGRVKEEATRSSDTWTMRAKERAAAERRDRQLEKRLAALRKTHGDAAVREVQALALERLGEIAERVGHDLLGTVATLQQVEEIAVRHLDARAVGTRDWDLSIGALQRTTRFLQSFAQDFRELLAAPAPIDLVRIDELIGSALQDARASVAGPHARVDVHVPSTLLATVPPGDVARCVANLVKNALEATPLTGSVQVRAWPQDRDLHIRVTDDGKGMSTEMQARCFEPFRTSKRSENNRPSGLGLAIVRRKVEDLLRGRVTLKSELGRGTTFLLELPGVVAE